MSLVLPRLIAGALGLLASILVLAISKIKGGAARKILGVLAGLAGIGIITQAAGQFEAASWAVRGTSLIPWFAFAALAIAQAALPFVDEKSKLASAFAAVSFAQLALGVCSLLTRWHNLVIGEQLWLQIQLGLLTLLLIDFALLLIAALAGRKKA
jgi:nitric oxide reductase large subunit